MGDLGYDEFEVTGEDGETVCLRVGGDMEPGEIIFGTCENTTTNPDRCVHLTDDGRRELIAILRRLGPVPYELQPHEPETDIEWKDGARTTWRGVCDCGWRGKWKSERGAIASAAMHAHHARLGLKRKKR